MIRNRHLMKSNTFGIFKETIWSPNTVQPIDIQNSIIFAHIFRKPQTWITPALCKKNVCHVRLPNNYINRRQTFSNNVLFYLLWSWIKELQYSRLIFLEFNIKRILIWVSIQLLLIYRIRNYTFVDSFM